MNTYFSRVASRNDPSRSSFMITPKPPVALADPQFMQKDAVEDVSFHVAPQLPENVVLPPRTHAREPVPPTRVETDPGTRITASPVQSHHTGYLLRHRERLQFSETKENTMAGINKPGTGSITSLSRFKGDEPAGAFSVTPDPVEKMQNDKGHMEGAASLKKKPSLLNPAAMKKVVTKPAAVNTPVTRLQPVPSNGAPANPATRSPVPKLVIGKITVEVIQPAKAATARAINRAVEVPLKNAGPSGNKLTFGLGQL